MESIRTGSSPDFCPPTEEGLCLSFEDDKGDVTEFEFLGLVLMDEARYGFFLELDDEHAPLSSGEVTVLEVVDLDEDGQPSEFELVEDEAVARHAYERFKTATRELYRFEA